MIQDIYIYYRINSSKEVKIGDFGLSRDIYVSDYYKLRTKDRPLPLRWMALESLESGKYTIKSDVVSSTMVLEWSKELPRWTSICLFE